MIRSMQSPISNPESEPEASVKSPVFHKTLRLLCALSAALLLTALVRARADDEQDDPPVVPVKVANNVRLTNNQIDQWVFGELGGVSRARERLQAMLDLEIEDIDRACQLTKEQRDKLELCGRGDLKRFFNRYETLKRSFQGLNQNDQRVQQMWQEIQPLQLELHAGLFKEGSLLRKSRRHTLTPEQLTRYEKVTSERNAFRHRANIEMLIGMIDQAAPLRAKQREALTTLLTDSTKPFKSAGRYEYYALMYQLSKLPEDQLKPIFDPAQWRVVNRLLAQGKAMRQVLKQNGMLDEEEDLD